MGTVVNIHGDCALYGIHGDCALYGDRVC
jgi:hypothetical protein